MSAALDLSAAELLAAARAAGLEVRLKPGGKVALAGPAEAREQWAQRLRPHREALAVLLRAEQTPARTCAACAHRTPARTCAQPVAAGLSKALAIVWPDPAQAARCPAFAARERPSAPATPGVADAAELQRMADRTARAVALGADIEQAECAAQRLHAAERTRDDRTLCIACAHVRAEPLGGWRCASARGLCGALARALVLEQLHRCDGFTPAD